MAAEEVINLDSSSEEEEALLENKENSHQEVGEEEEEEEEGEIQEDGLNEIGLGDDPNEEDMDLGDDDVVVPKQSVIHAGAEVFARGLNSSTVIQSSTDIIYTDQAPSRGVKRARIEHTENEPSVRVVFCSLTRESKRKLMELMQQWSEWQAMNSSSLLTETKEETLESGEEIYYSALQVGSSTSKISTMSFWIDNQARTDDVKDENSVPLYDRGFTLSSSSLDGSATFDRSSKDDARCFNCGSYGHALKECPRPRDMAAINSARRQHSAKKNLSSSNHGQNRYYETKPEKYGDLKPGVLGPEARECLGIGEFDPPPWFHRMREMGYPPGYIEIVEETNKPSGITIFTDKEEQEKNSDKKDDYEEGELPDQIKQKSPKKIMTVEFPGINGPIPEKADPLLWSVSPLSAPAPIYPPRYNPYDQYNGSSSQSPILGRSLSDRGRHDGSLSAPGSYSSLHPYNSSNPDVPTYYGRDWERDRGREPHDHRRHHHHRRR